MCLLLLAKFQLTCLHGLQSGVIDLEVMAMALACCWVPPLKQLSRHKPPPYACTFSSLTLLACAAGGLQMVQIFMMAFLCTRPGFMGRPGSAHLVSHLIAADTLQCNVHVSNNATNNATDSAIINASDNASNSMSTVTSLSAAERLALYLPPPCRQRTGY